MADAPIDDDVWQRRFERLGAWALVAAAATPFALASQAYVNQRASRAFSTDAIDVVAVLRAFGRGAGPASGALVVAAFLLVAWGPGDRIGRSGSRVLQATVLVGLVLAVVAGFALLDVLATGNGILASGGVSGDDPDAFTTVIARLGGALPLLAGGALAALGAWLAFSTLGEVPAEADLEPPTDESSTDDLALG